MIRRAVTCLAACLLLAGTARAAEPGDESAREAREWLERMSEALATQNYDGLFTHSTGSRSETMRIVHRVRDGKSLERLVSLDGSGREVLRTPTEVHAYLPDHKVVLVEPRKDEGSLLNALPTPGPKLDRYYAISATPGAKLLGRDIVIIDVRPRDAYRYGYRLWLDGKTAMPLRSVVADANGRTIEQIQFTQLEVKDRIAARDIEPGVDAAGFQWVRTQRQPIAMPQLPAGNWRAVRVPPGFRLVASRIQVLPGSPMPAQHLIFSDGMASISVFIEPGSPTGPRPPEASSMGSANAFTTSAHGHVVTAIGEAPPGTVREIAMAVEPVPLQQPATAPAAASAGAP
jgi:sigma-E factor negative regulatory protein RseB